MDHGENRASIPYSDPIPFGPHPQRPALVTPYYLIHMFHDINAHITFSYIKVSFSILTVFFSILTYLCYRQFTCMHIACNPFSVERSSVKVNSVLVYLKLFLLYSM